MSFKELSATFGVASNNLATNVLVVTGTASVNVLQTTSLS
jgi:hypothetical protein